jgi:hypothetical protein
VALASCGLSGHRFAKNPLLAAWHAQRQRTTLRWAAGRAVLVSPQASLPICRVGYLSAVVLVELQAMLGGGLLP